MWLEILACAVIIYAVLHVASHYYQQHSKGLPPGPIPLPIIGNLHLLGTSPHVAMKNLSRKYGDIYRIYFGPQLAIVVTHVDIALEGLVQKTTEFAGRPKLYTLDLASGDGKGIAFVDYGPMWRLVRKIGHSSLRMYGDGINHLEALVIKESEELHKRFDACLGKPINPHHDAALAIMNVICAMIFGSRYDINDEEFLSIIQSNVTFVRAFEYDNLVDIFPLMRLLPNRRVEMMKKALAIREPVLTRQLREHRMKFDGETVHDMTDSLIKAADDAIANDKEAQKYLTDDHLYKIMDDMFGAGSETTTTTMRWAFLFFAHWPEVQDKAYHTIMAEIGPGRLPTANDRPNLPYVDAVVHEVLRMACIAPFAVPHKTTCDTTLAGYQIKKDTQIFFNIWALHYDEREWKDPLIFNPDRFLDESGHITPGAQKSYLPFSAGRRVCLAETLAKLELFLLISRLLHDYKFLPDPNEPLPNLDGIYGLFLAPKPYKIVIKRRENNNHYFH
eukprot:gene9725-10716_t